MGFAKTSKGDGPVGDSAASDALSFYLAVTRLHEYTPYGDFANGIHFPGETGTTFEQAVFGVMVGEDNARQVLMELTNH